MFVSYHLFVEFYLAATLSPVFQLLFIFIDSCIFTSSCNCNNDRISVAFFNPRSKLGNFINFTFN